MHRKHIKSLIKEQLKERYPNWKRLSGKDKKIIARRVLAEVIKLYGFNKPIETPTEELLGIQEQAQCNDLCEIPMQRIGCEEQCHEFRCGAAPVNALAQSKILGLYCLFEKSVYRKKLLFNPLFKRKGVVS